MLEAAYNDSRGITAAFNRNLIDRIQAEFNVEISLEAFDHFALFNKEESRIEMHLVSRDALTLKLGDDEINFARGEHIVTEYSYKYTPEAFEKVLTASRFEIQDRWNDSQDYFEVCYANVHK